VSDAVGSVNASYDSEHHRVVAVVPDNGKELDLSVTY